MDMTVVRFISGIQFLDVNEPLFEEIDRIQRIAFSPQYLTLAGSDLYIKFDEQGFISTIQLTLKTRSAQLTYSCLTQHSRMSFSYQWDSKC